MILDLVKQVH